MLEEDLELLEQESQNEAVNKLFIYVQNDTAVISDLSKLYL